MAAAFRLDSDFSPTGGNPGVITLTLRNTGDQPIANFKLALTSLFRVKTGSAIEGGTIAGQISNHHEIAPPEHFVLQPGAAWSVSARTLSHTLTHYNYGPKSAYLILADGNVLPVETTYMTFGGKAGKPLLDPKPRGRLPAAAPPLAVIPFPAKVSVSGQQSAGAIAFAGGPASARSAHDTVAALAARLFPGEPIFATSGDIAVTSVDERMAGEAYRIAFAGRSITVAATGMPGYRAAFITLGQILRGARNTPEEFAFPASGEISDAPRFGWRGMMLDVARQAYTVDELRRLGDKLAWLKLNRYHLHLTDDEGWRLDIPGYPELAGIAGWRGHGLPVPPLLGSGAAREGLVYGRGELAAFARDSENLGLIVVPEVDIPGHNYAALQALPRLRDPAETGLYQSVQYFPNDALNPAREETYEFLDAVFDELCAIFPSPWIHVGGDEVAEGAWLGSPQAVALMRQNNWTDIHQLQSYFLQRVQKMLRERGRSTGAWEEAALGGGVDAKDSFLVAWRKSASGIWLANEGYDVVLAPAEAYYLDMAQSDEWWDPGASWAGTVTPEMAYAYEPGNDWPDSAKPRLLGVQVNLWSENMYDKRLVDHMIFPRTSAAAETAWSPAGTKDYARFAAIAPLVFGRS